MPAPDDDAPDLDAAVLAYANGGNSADAAKAAGISRTAFFTLKNSDAAFAARIVEARKTARPRKRAAAARRDLPIPGELAMFPAPERDPLESVADYPKALLGDADAAPGPSCGELLRAAWARLSDKGTVVEGVAVGGCPPAVEAKLWDLLFKFKLGPLLIEQQRAAAAQDVGGTAVSYTVALPPVTPVE